MPSAGIASRESAARWFAIAVSLVAGFPALGGCTQGGGSGHTVVVDLRTDLVVDEEFDTVRVFLSQSDGSNGAWLRELPASGEVFLPGARVAELSDVPPGDYRLDLQLEDRQRGRVLVSRPALLSVRDSTGVTLPIDRACVNVLCPPLDDPETVEDESERTACLQGACVSPRCSVETPEFCDVAVVCEDDKNTAAGNEDCQFASSCARGLCIDGLCWASAAQEGDAGSCGGAEQWCHPNAGCLDRGELSPAACGDNPAPCSGLFSSATESHCLDGIANHGEQGVDCGGDCVPCSAAFDCASQSDVPPHECLALVALYEQTVGPTWRQSAGWLDSQNVCAWQGITCDEGRVTALDLPNNLLQGALPSAIANLRRLVTLHLNNNALLGTIPPELSLLSELETLHLLGASLVGSIPPELGELTRLRQLLLGDNALLGWIPEEIGRLSALEELDLSQNALSGTIPSSLGNLSLLDELLLMDNSLSGPIPSSITNLTQLSELWLSNNRLAGELPLGLEQLPLDGFPGVVLHTNACLWTSSCDVLQPWLDDRGGPLLNHGADCVLPPEACQ